MTADLDVLVERLQMQRWETNEYEQRVPVPVCSIEELKKAATEITALRAEVAKNLDSYRASISTVWDLNGKIKALESRALAAEAAVEKAVEALTFYSGEWFGYRADPDKPLAGDNIAYEPSNALLNDEGERAADALAAIRTLGEGGA